MRDADKIFGAILGPFLYGFRGTRLPILPMLLLVDSVPSVSVTSSSLEFRSCLGSVLPIRTVQSAVLFCYDSPLRFIKRGFES